jgi:hypothetical protein
MALMPGAEFLGPHGGGRLMDRWDIVCLHTIVGFAPAHAAHFSTKADGRILQSRDTRFRSGANEDGNHRIIAIENEDHGPAFGVWDTDDGHAVPAFTAAQIEANAQICAWANRVHGVPLVACPNSRSTSRGIAYHRQGIKGNFSAANGFAFPGLVSGGEVWTTSPGKVCPGDRRIAQIATIIARAIQINEGDDDMPTPEQLWGHVIAFDTKAGTMLSEARTNAMLARQNTHGLAAQVAALKAALNAVAAKVDIDPGELTAITAAAQAGAAAALEAATIADQPAGLLPAMVVDLDDAGLAEIATAVADEQARRLQ